jgi:hypothetical protein
MVVDFLLSRADFGYSKVKVRGKVMVENPEEKSDYIAGLS